MMLQLSAQWHQANNAQPKHGTLSSLRKKSHNKITKRVSLFQMLLLPNLIAICSIDHLTVIAALQQQYALPRRIRQQQHHHHHHHHHHQQQQQQQQKLDHQHRTMRLYQASTTTTAMNEYFDSSFKMSATSLPSSVNHGDNNASSSSSSSSSSSPSSSLKDAVSAITSACFKVIADNNDDDDAAELEQISAIAVKQQIVQARMQLERSKNRVVQPTRSITSTTVSPTNTMTPSFRVKIPLIKVASVGADTTASQQFNIGVTLVQIGLGKQVSDEELDLNTFKIEKRELFNRPIISSSSVSVAMMDETKYDQSTVDSNNRVEYMDQEALRATISSSFRGIVVSSIVRECEAWKQGVRPGDIVVAASATIGDSMWPKSTIEGVRSALLSRSLIADNIALDIRSIQPKGMNSTLVDTSTNVSSQTSIDKGDPLSMDTTHPNRYELCLTKPIGLTLAESNDGYVVVTGYTEQAPKMVQYAVRIGDRVLAVDSSIGGSMWPVSTVEGVVSACTSRFPGQSIRMQFERPDSSAKENDRTEISFDSVTKATLPATENVVRNAVQTAVLDNDAAITWSYDQRLLSRCRKVLRRYSAKSLSSSASTKQNLVLNGQSRFIDKYAIPAVVADKVVDAIAAADTAIDSRTLSLLMHAYLSCGKATNAIRVFEAAVGLSGDGSTVPTTTIIQGGKGGRQRIRPQEESLNLYTATALLQAHALNDDVGSVLRVLAALAGRSGVDILGRESAPWPWTGAYGCIQPDSQCFNIAMGAVARSDVDQALAIFDSLADPVSEKQTKGSQKLQSSSSPTKDLVSFNTAIFALVSAGRYNDAFDLFYRLKKCRLRPDKFTYTTLLKACKEDVDALELLYDMKENGVEPDVVTFNSRIESLCKSRNLSMATKLVSEMESKGISPDARTYGLLMSAMLATNRPAACLTLFESACATETTTALTENLYLYTTAITAAASLGAYERALELLARMTRKGVRPNVKTLTAVVGACLAGNQPDLACQVYERINHPDGYAMAQGIRAYCGAGFIEKASQLLLNHKRHCDPLSGKDAMQAYKTVLQSACEARNITLAKLLFTDMLEKGYIPNNSIWMSMLHTAAQNGDFQYFQFLLFVIDRLVERNLPIEGPLYSATISLGCRLDDVCRALASLLFRARQNAEKTGGKRLLTAPSASAKGTVGWSWEERLIAVAAGDETSLTTPTPVLDVRIAKRDLVRAIRAETRVQSRARRQRKVPSGSG
jgi:pentatricopeptide repeat protein